MDYGHIMSERAKAMYPTWPNCPSCGQAPAAVTIFPDEPSGHFGTCADKFHTYPWAKRKDGAS